MMGGTLLSLLKGGDVGDAVVDGGDGGDVDVDGDNYRVQRVIFSSLSS